MTQPATLRRTLQALAITAALMGSTAVLAHGAPDPQHGGIVQAASDLGFELVSTNDGISLYVTDHGQDYDATKLNGTVTVLQGAEKSEAALKPAGGNKLEAAGVKLSAGAKVVAILNGAGAKPVTVRFTVK